MSGEYIGRKISLGIAKEASRGVAESAPDFWLRISEQNHKDQVEYINSIGNTNTIVSVTHSEADKQWSEGGFVAEIDAESIGLVLLALFGDVNSASSGDGYLHEYTLEEDANHQSLTLFTAEPGRDATYALCCLNNLSFNFERGKVLDFTVDLMGQAGESDTQSPTFAAAKRFLPKDFHFYFAADIAGLAGASETPLKTMTLDFNKNLEADDVLGLESPQNFLNKAFEVTANLSLNYTGETLREIFQAGTPQAMRVRIQNADNILTAAVAATGSYTVVDYSALAGVTVTVGGTVLTEGVEWNRGGSNGAAATSLASAINALTSVNATPSSATVNVVAATAGTAGNAITLATTGAGNLTKSGNNLTGGAEAITEYLVFDFARAYIATYEEQNGRDDIKAITIGLTFGVNTEEGDIPFMEARLLNDTASY